MTRRAWAEAGFWLVALAPVLAIVVLPRLVVQDGGLHLTAATALGQLWSGDFAGSIEFRPGLPPNTVLELVLLGLLQIFSAGVALKIVVAALLLGFALAARSLVTAAGAPAPWAVLLLPFAWNRPLAWGFLDFVAAVVLGMLAIAMVLRRPERPPVLALALLLTLTWFTHLVPAVAAGLICLVIAATAALGRRTAAPGTRGNQVAGIGRVVLAGVPAAVLTVVFTALNRPGASPPQPDSLKQRVLQVVGMTRADVSTVHLEYDAYRLVALLMYAAAAVSVLVRLRGKDDGGGWRLRPADGLLAAAALSMVVAVLAPVGVDGAGGFLGMRLALYPSLLLAAWVAGELGRPIVGAAAGEPTSPRAGRSRQTALAVGAGVLAGAISLLLVVSRYPTQHRFSDAARQVDQVGACLPVRSTVFQLFLDDGGSQAVQLQPYDGIGGFVETERNSLDMGNEAGWVPYYLWRYRDAQRPDTRLGIEANGLYDVPPRVNLAGALAGGLRLDAILVLGRPTAAEDTLADGPTKQTLADLAANYRQVRVSSAGTAELWLRKGLNPSC